MPSQKKHILLLNRSFWPDVQATGQLLTELCEALVKKYDVTVIAGRSPYVGEERFKAGRFYLSQHYKGIKILRVREMRFAKKGFKRRLITWGSYCLLVFAAAVRIRPDLIIVCTDPPFLAASAMAIGRLCSIPFIYNCRDLYPDIAITVGKLKPCLRSSVFEYFNKKAFRAAAYIVCLGPSMCQRIKAKGAPLERLVVIPDWVDTKEVHPVLKEENALVSRFGLQKKFIVMYSGNIGLTQDFDSIIEAWETLKDNDFTQLVFIGEGARKEELRTKIKRRGFRNVLFMSYQPKEDLSYSLGMADLHLVPLKKNLAGAVVPSKVYGIMAAGRPFLAITDRTSEPAQMAEEYGCGFWVVPHDAKAAAEKIKWAVQHPAELKEMGAKGRILAVERFDKKKVIEKWFEILERMGI